MMKAYMAYDRIAGSDEGACLVIAENTEVAKKLAWPIVLGWGAESYPDMTVKLLREPNKQARELIAEGVACIEDDPTCCKKCNMWGGELYEEQCSICGESNEETNKTL